MRSGEQTKLFHNLRSVRMRSGEQTKLFHNLRSYFYSKFSETRKENERSAKEIEKCIKKAIPDLETQDKMIKIAHKSPGDWKTVEVYLSVYTYQYC